MNQNSNEHSVTEDEINLYDLWKVIAKRKVLIIAVFLISVFSAAITSSIMQKVYQGEAVLKIASKDISELIQANMIINTFNPINQGKVGMISPQNAVAIMKANFVEIKGFNDRFKVVVQSKDPGKIQDFVKDLVMFLNENTEIKHCIEDCKELLTKRAHELALVIGQSESLKKSYEKMLQNGKVTTLGFSPISLERQLSDMRIEKLIIEKRLENISGIEVVGKPSVSNQPVKPRIKMNIALAGMASLFAGVFLAFFLEFLSKAKNKASSSP